MDQRACPERAGPFLRIEGRRLPDRKHSLAAKRPGEAHGRYGKGARNCNARAGSLEFGTQTLGRRILRVEGAVCQTESTA